MGDRPQRGASAGLVVRQGHSRITVGLERTRVELLDLLDAGVGLCVVLFGALVLMKGQDDRRAAVAFWRMSLPIGLAMGVIPAGFHGILWAIALTFVALALFGPALLDLTLVFPSTDTPVLLRRLIWLPALVLLAFYIPCWRYPAPLFVLVSNASDGLLAGYILATCARLVWVLSHPRSALQRTQLRFLTCGLVCAFLPWRCSIWSHTSWPVAIWRHPRRVSSRLSCCSLASASPLSARSSSASPACCTGVPCASSWAWLC